jgi:thiol:disulfide interchange protein DsbA
MKQLSLLLLALVAIAGCGQSEDSASVAAQTVAQSAPAAETAPAPAAQAVAGATAAAIAEATPTGQAAESRIQLAQVDLSSVEAAGFIEGQHYRRIGAAAQRTNTGADQVEVDEFFMHSCIHCFNLEPYVQAWLPNKPDYINFVRIPTTWNPTVKMHAQAFYTAQTLGKIEEMHMPMFREMHDNRNYLETPDAMAQFFARFDVSRADFDRTFNSFSVNTAVNRADELGSRYRVDATPTIIINGKYTTGPGMAGGYEELFELIEALAAAELGR